MSMPDEKQRGRCDLPRSHSELRIKLELRLVPGSEMPSITPIHCQAPKEKGGS